MKKTVTLICCFMILVACSTTDKNPEDNQNPDPKSEEVVEDTIVSCLSVGDNLIHNAVYLDPYHVQNGVRDYTAIYENTNYLTQNVDIANINQETILGGTELGLKSYPTFNSPHEIGDAIVKSGFNWISQASNHAFDEGEQGVISAMNFWDKHPDVVTTGINRTAEEEKKPRILEKKGIKFGLLNYTYGLNGFFEPNGKDYLVNDIDLEKMKKDIEGLKNQTDVIMVSLHMGVEYQYEENQEQREMFQHLSDFGVDIILGSHPHVIEPVTYLTGASGNKTLAVYSLGNFVSAQDEPERMLGGMINWDFLKNGKTGEITIENTQYHPTITFYRPNMVDFRTYVLKDYNNEIAATHGLAPNVTREYYINLVNKIIGTPENIEVVY